MSSNAATPLFHITARLSGPSGQSAPLVRSFSMLVARPGTQRLTCIMIEVTNWPRLHSVLIVYLASPCDNPLIKRVYGPVN